VLIFPAIDGSRFQSRLASCQDGLQQFGVALSQYGLQQRDRVVQLAGGGRLTQAGVTVVGRLLREKCLDESRRTLCPDAWLAAQGVLSAILHVENSSSATPEKGVRTICFAPNNSSDPFFTNPDVNWSGTWRTGMTNGRQAPPMPAATPLLADAPSADLPDQDISSHGGRGRNVLFEDGRVDFVPSAAAAESSEWALLRGPDSSVSAISTPVVWVSGRR
jgi:hypothetical protein